MNELKVTFKAGLNPNEYNVLHPGLEGPLETVVFLLDRLGYDTEITSMLRMPGRIKGESNVHSTGRAIDCVPRMRENSRKPYTPNMQMIATMVNASYKRNDQKLTCLYHDSGLGNHFHIQVMATADFKDLRGVMPQ